MILFLYALRTHFGLLSRRGGDMSQYILFWILIEVIFSIFLFMPHVLYVTIILKSLLFPIFLLILIMEHVRCVTGLALRRLFSNKISPTLSLHLQSELYSLGRVIHIIASYLRLSARENLSI